MKKMLAFMIVLAGMVLPVSAQTQAQKMVELLPPDLLVVIANSGWDRLRPQFEQSDLGKVWHEKSVQTFYGQVRDALLTRLRAKMEDEGKDGAKLDAAVSLLKSVLFSGPLVLAVGDRAGPKGPQVYGFLILSAGDRKPQIVDNLTRLESLAEKGKISEVTVGKIKMHMARKDKDCPPVMWGWVDNYLVAVVNDERAMIVQHLARGGLAKRGPSMYMAALDKLPNMGEGRLVYVDVGRIARVVKMKLEGEYPLTASRPTARVASQVMADLGLAGVKTLTARGGFAGRDSAVESLLTAPAPRKGIFEHIRPVDLSILDRVPASAIEAGTSNVDWAGLYDLAMHTIRAVKPEKFAEVEKAMAEFETRAGFKIRPDLLGNLAGPAVGYSVPVAGMMMGPMLGGKVVILKLKDGRAFEKAMTAVERFIEQKSEGKFQATAQDVDGGTVHFWMIPQLAMMQLTPAWTVHGDEFILATNLQQVTAAVAQATTRNAAAQSIRSVAGFTAVTKDLPKDIISLRYVDHRRESERTMQFLQQFWPMIATMLQQQGKVQLPMFLPPAADVSRHLGAEAAYSWFTPEGIRGHDSGSLVSANTGTVIGAAVATSILMPALARARHAAKTTGPTDKSLKPMRRPASRPTPTEPE